VATVGGIGLSIAAAYLAQHYNNILDVLQLVFSFVNAPLFATFLLGMFWKRTTGHAAFTGLLAGTASAALTHGLTVAEGKGGWIAALHEFPSTMAQNLWIAIFAWSACFAVTVLVSMATDAKPKEQLAGLVYGMNSVKQEAGPWFRRPGPLALIVGAATLLLNVLFW
jgi:solute:Na+ symporter, SSS family